MDIDGGQHHSLGRPDVCRKCVWVRCPNCFATRAFAGLGCRTTASERHCLQWFEMNTAGPPRVSSPMRAERSTSNSMSKWRLASNEMLISAWQIRLFPEKTKSLEGGRSGSCERRGIGAVAKRSDRGKAATNEILAISLPRRRGAAVGSCLEVSRWNTTSRKTTSTYLADDGHRSLPYTRFPMR